MEREALLVALVGGRTTASSPSTKAAVRPRKCAATTGAPAATARVRSTTEGVLGATSVAGSVTDACDCDRRH